MGPRYQEALGVCEKMRREAERLRELMEFYQLIDPEGEESITPEIEIGDVTEGWRACSRCGFYGPVEGMTDECCRKGLGLECVFKHRTTAKKRDHVKQGPKDRPYQEDMLREVGETVGGLEEKAERKKT